MSPVSHRKLKISWIVHKSSYGFAIQLCYVDTDVMCTVSVWTLFERLKWKSTIVAVQ